MDEGKLVYSYIGGKCLTLSIE